MILLISIGILSGLFFSSTFILNRLMSLEGGHWVWSACLRYAYMILFLTALISIFQGVRATGRLWRLFVRHRTFWVISGSIGFGGFYSLICFSADHAPGWVVATTWQLTILASLVILMCFGRSFPRRIWLFSSIVFLGVLMVNVSHADITSANALLMAVFPYCLPLFAIRPATNWYGKRRRATGFFPI
jgi:drug/metabolite transporter (DMT)-like permease